MSRSRAASPTYSLTSRSGWLYVQWWEAGTARRVSCRTKELAAAKRFLAEFKAGRETPPPPESPTIGVILDGYLEDRRGKVHSDSIEYECKTLRAALGDLPVVLLGDEQVARYVADRRKAGAGGASAKYRKHKRPLSNGTLIRELGTLRYALAWGVRKGWLASAPHIERPEAPPPRDRWLTREEAASLLEAAHAPHIRLFISLALGTAARTGALLELQWNQIDLAHERINLGRGRGLKRRAILPMIPELRRELEAAKEGHTSPYVIDHAGRPVASIKTGFRAACRRAGITGITPHILRHTAATWMVQAGVPLAKVAAFLGDSIKMVEKVYGHHAPDWLREAGEALRNPSPLA